MILRKLLLSIAPCVAVITLIDTREIEVSSAQYYQLERIARVRGASIEATVTGAIASFLVENPPPAPESPSELPYDHSRRGFAHTLKDETEIRVVVDTTAIWTTRDASVTGYCRAWILIDGKQVDPDVPFGKTKSGATIRIEISSSDSTLRVLPMGLFGNWQISATGEVGDNQPALRVGEASFKLALPMHTLPAEAARVDGLVPTLGLPSHRHKGLQGRQEIWSWNAFPGLSARIGPGGKVDSFDSGYATVRVAFENMYLESGLSSKVEEQGSLTWKDFPQSLNVARIEGGSVALWSGLEEPKFIWAHRTHVRCSEAGCKWSEQ